MESEAAAGGAKAGSSEGANKNGNGNGNGLDDVTASLHRSLALLHQLHCTVAAFTPTSQLALLERLNSLVVELSSMHNAAQNCHIQVPAEVVRFIDEGRNPDEFTKDLISNCIQQNQATKGKVDAFKMLRKHLLEEIDGAFPEEAEAYRDLRTKSALELRKITQASSALPNGDVKVKTEH